MKVEEYLEKNEKVKSLFCDFRWYPLRYYLASSSFGPKSNYANVMVETKDPEDAAEVEQQFYEHMTQNFPNIIIGSAVFSLQRLLHQRIADHRREVTAAHCSITFTS